MSEASRPRRGWPPRMVEIADLIGDGAALRLVQEFGGLQIVIPSKPRPHHQLWKIMGEVAAHALADLYGAQKIDIPTMRGIRSKKLAILEARGSNRQIVRDLGVTERYVRAVRNGGRDSSDSDQMNLFPSSK